MTAEQRSDEKSTTLALEADFQRALEYCDTQMIGLRESFEGSGKQEIALASVGIIAGSVIVPALAAKAAAAKSAIAGWGGISGAANAAQYTLQQKGKSASRIGAVYESMRGEIRKAAEDYAKATKNSERIVAVNKISIACRFPQLPSADSPAPPASQPAD